MKNKIIILHDTFLYKWWWERLILMMAKILKSDLASWFFSKGSFDLRQSWFKWKIITVSTEIFKKWFRHLKLKSSFLFNTKFVKNYDIVIFSWDCISAVRNCKKNTKKIYYCHTPPRYLYDLKNIYIQKINIFLRPFFVILSFIFKKMYERDIKKMDLILTNSINTQKRIKKFLWIDSIVLYPPVDLEEFQYISSDDYYLSFARLSEAKRVNLIVESFKKMPNKHLLVIYWENDPDKDKIIDLWKGYSNIVFKTLKNNKWFKQIVGKCLATIYIPIDEDFGMSVVESMSAWKPVLWVNEGWLIETIINKKTWILIPENPSINNITDAVIFLDKKKCLSMKNDCQNRALDFSLKVFEKKLRNLVFNI